MIRSFRWRNLGAPTFRRLLRRKRKKLCFIQTFKRGSLKRNQASTYFGRFVMRYYLSTENNVLGLWHKCCDNNNRQKQWSNFSSKYLQPFGPVESPWMWCKNLPILSFYKFCIPKFFCQRSRITHLVFWRSSRWWCRK